MNKRITWLGLGLLALMTGGVTQADQTFTWVPTSGDNDWNTPANWTPAGPPGSTGITDIALVPNSAGGTLNYNTQGPVLRKVNVRSDAAPVKTLNINAPMTVITSDGNWGDYGFYNLTTKVNAGGSLTSRDGMLELTGGYFDVEPGGAVTLLASNAANRSFFLLKTTLAIRGSVSANTYLSTWVDGNNPTHLRESTVRLDGGSLTTEGVITDSGNSALEFTGNGGSLKTALFGCGIYLSGCWYNPWVTTLTMDAGTVTNEGPFVVAAPDEVNGATTVGSAKATLKGGTFNQNGYTTIGNGRVGTLVVTGGVFRTRNDVYVGGGDQVPRVKPASPATAAGTLTVAAGNMTITNAPISQTSGLQTSHYNSGGKMIFYLTLDELFPRAGQRIVFTSLDPAIQRDGHRGALLRPVGELAIRTQSLFRARQAHAAEGLASAGVGRQPGCWGLASLAVRMHVAHAAGHAEHRQPGDVQRRDDDDPRNAQPRGRHPDRGSTGGHQRRQ